MDVILDRIFKAITELDDFLRARQTTFEARYALIETLNVLVPRLSSEQRAQTLAFACRNLSKTGDDFELRHHAIPHKDNFEATHWAEVTDSLLQLKSEKDHAATLIEVLKFPTSADQPTEVLIAGFRTRFSDAPRSLADLAGWIRQRHPELETNFRRIPDETCRSPT